MMVWCCAPGRDLVWNPWSLPPKDLPTGIAGFKLPEPGFQGSPRLVGRPTKLARRNPPHAVETRRWPLTCRGRTG